MMQKRHQSDTINELQARYPEKFRKQWQGLKPGVPAMVMCPATIPDKWKSEMESTYPKFRAVICETMTDVRKVFEAAKAETDPEIIHTMIITYESAKLGEGWSPAYQLALGKKNGGWQRVQQMFPDGRYRNVWIKTRYVIDPVTGHNLVGTDKRNNGPIDQKTILKKSKGSNRQRFIYEGRVFDGYREAMESVETKKYSGEFTEVRTMVEAPFFAFNRRADLDAETHRHLPLPMWQQTRVIGVNKIKPGDNGRCLYDEVEYEVPEKTWRWPVYRKEYNREKGEDERIFVEWREMVRPAYTIIRKVFKENLIPDEPVQDEWLAMKGIRIYDTSRKTKKMDELMDKHKLKHYRIGQGIPELDKALQKAGISHYYAGVGIKEWKNPRYPLALYIRKYCEKNHTRVGLLIVDELHRGQAQDTDVSYAIRNACFASDKILGMTGTLYGGKASSLFNIEYTFNRAVRRMFKWSKNPMDWINTMGATESVYVTAPKQTRYGVSGYERYAASEDKEIPSASPLLIPLLSDHTLYADLEDLNESLPVPHWQAVEITPNQKQMALYSSLEATVTAYMRSCVADGDHSFTGAYYQCLLGILDMMFRPNEVIHRRKKRGSRGYYDREQYESHPVMTIPPLGDEANPKELKTVEIIRNAMEAGEKTIVFASHTRTKDIRGRIMEVIQKELPESNPFILGDVDTRKRMPYIEKMMDAGHNVMICNPKLVAEGVDLVWFNHTVFFQNSPSLKVMSQAAARTRRLNQMKQDVYVWWLYYGVKYPAAELLNIARKTRAAQTIYGSGDGGLSDLSDTGAFLHDLVKTIEENAVISQASIQEEFDKKFKATSDFRKSAWFAVPRREYIRSGMMDMKVDVESEIEEVRQNSSEEDLFN